MWKAGRGQRERSQKEKDSREGGKKMVGRGGSKTTRKKDGREGWQAKIGRKMAGRVEAKTGRRQVQGWKKWKAVKQRRKVFLSEVILRQGKLLINVGEGGREG